MSQESNDHGRSNESEPRINSPRLKTENAVAEYEIDLFRNASLADIQFLFNFIDRVVLNRVVENLMDAERVLVVGAGENQSSALFMSYLGSLELVNWYPITLCNPMSETLLEGVTSADVVLAISTYPGSDQNPFKDHTIQVAKRVRDNGASVIAIIDQAETALTSIAKHVLFAPTYSKVLRSQIVTAILIETIVGVAVLRSEF